MAEARIYPPSEQRVAEARRAGLAPRTSLVVFAALSMGSAWAFERWGTSFSARLAASFRAQLETFARGGAPDARAVLLTEVPRLVGPVLLLIAALWLVAVALAWLAQGSARFVPTRRPRSRFGRVRAPLVSKLLYGCLLVLLCLAASYELMRVSPASSHWLWSRWLVRLGALSSLLALFDAALARLSFTRALWLTRREHIEEQREAYGAPEVRAARARVRQADLARSDVP